MNPLMSSYCSSVLFFFPTNILLNVYFRVEFFLITRFGGGFYTISKIILGVTEGFGTEYQLEDVSKNNC